MQAHHLWHVLHSEEHAAEVDCDDLVEFVYAVVLVRILFPLDGRVVEEVVDGAEAGGGLMDEVAHMLVGDVPRDSEGLDGRGREAQGTGFSSSGAPLRSTIVNSATSCASLRAAGGQPETALVISTALR